MVMDITHYDPCLDFPILRYCSGTVSDSAMIVKEIKIKIQDEFMVI